MSGPRPAVDIDCSHSTTHDHFPSFRSIHTLTRHSIVTALPNAEKPYRNALGQKTLPKSNPPIPKIPLPPHTHNPARFPAPRPASLPQTAAQPTKAQTGKRSASAGRAVALRRCVECRWGPSRRDMRKLTLRLMQHVGWRGQGFLGGRPRGKKIRGRVRRFGLEGLFTRMADVSNELLSDGGRGDGPCSAHEALGTETSMSRRHRITSNNMMRHKRTQGRSPPSQALPDKEVPISRLGKSEGRLPVVGPRVSANATYAPRFLLPVWSGEGTTNMRC